MTDDQVEGVQEPAEAPAQDVPASESQEQVVDQQPTQQPESTEAVTDQTQEGEVPKDNKAWAAMRTENKRLKEALDNVDPAYLESLRGATAPQPMYPQRPVPQVTGDADYNQVVQGVNSANSQAARANEQLARLQMQIELQQDKEAERAFPELKTDKSFQQLVAEKKLAARVLGHDRTTFEIAEEVSRILNKREQQVAQQASETTKQQMAERQVVSSEPRGRTSGGRSTITNDELKLRVRKGDSEAETEVAKGLIADLNF